MNMTSSMLYCSSYTFIVFPNHINTRCTGLHVSEASTSKSPFLTWPLALKLLPLRHGVGDEQKRVIRVPLGPKNHEILLMEEILHQLVGSLSRYLQGFIHSRWCKIFSINIINMKYEGFGPSKYWSSPLKPCWEQIICSCSNSQWVSSSACYWWSIWGYLGV